MARRHNGEGTIYPYRKGYAAQVWITTPEGRRQRKTVYGATREAVHAKWLKLHERARHGPVVPVSPNLADFLSRWLDEVIKPGLAPATAANYEMFVRLYIVPDLGRRKLEKLSVRDVQTWVNQLRVRCQCCAQGKDAQREEPQCCAAGRCCGQVLSAWTVHQAYAVLRAALSQAAREELVSRNVAALVRVSVPRSTSRNVWTVEDARRFLESSRDSRDPYHAGYVLLLVLGLRRGEVLGLTWPDVDLAAGEARIQWQLQRVDGSLALRRTKTTSSEAVLPLPEICAEALTSHRAMTNVWRLAAGSAWHDTGLVLSTRYGLPIDPRNFHRKFKERATAAGVPVVPVHSTRRTCASLLVELDVHPRVAMQILRHSQIAVTMDIYSQVASASTREALTRLGSRLDYGRN